MRKHSATLLLALTVGAALLLGSVPSQAAQPAADTPVKTKAKKKTVKSKSVKRGNSAKFLPGSEETKKERDNRLRRECKGAANAGVCAGYAGN